MISVLINGTERNGYIDWKTFKKENVITMQVDTLSFKTKKWEVVGWKPEVEDEIVVYDGATKIFGGNIVEVSETIVGKIIYFDVKCKDYLYLLDKKLVFDTYETENIEDIIDDLVSTYCPGFTTTNVAVTGVELSYILFNYKEPSKCIQQLAELIGYDWYVDYDKDIHFFSKTTGETAPFNLTDINGNYIFNTLKVVDDISQLRNIAYVRGGEYVADSRSDKVGEGDGVTKCFNLPYRYDVKPTVTVNAVSKTVGVDYLDSEDSYDCLWNYQEKVLKFKTPPASGDVVVTGSPLVIVLIKAKNNASIVLYGEIECAIVDKTLVTKAAARQRAQAEFYDYALPIKTASFETHKSGLNSGQKINIQSDIRTLNQNFIISKVTSIAKTPDKLYYRVEASTARVIGIIEFLQKQIEDVNKKIGVFRQEGEVLDVIIDIQDIDTITITELFSFNDYKMDLSAVDTATLSESLIRMIKNSPPVWCCGNYFPINDLDRKRPAFCDRSCFLAS